MNPQVGEGLAGRQALLSRRPTEVASAEKMNVQMRNGFAAVGAVVDDDAETLGEVFAAGDLGGGEQEVAEQRLVLRGCGGDTGQRFFRNDEDVDGGLWRDVAEGEAEFVLMHDVCGDFAGGDFFEKGHASRR